MASAENPIHPASSDIEIPPPETVVDYSVVSGTDEVKPSPEASKENQRPSHAKKPSSSGTTTKRLVTGSTTTKRPGTSSSATGRPSTSALKGAADGSTLNKPPTRPATTVATSTARKPPTAIVTTVSHRSRASISSSADEKSKSIASSGDERKTLSASAKRMSITGSASARAPAKSATSTADRRTSIVGPLADKKTTPSRNSSTSSSRPVGKSVSTPPAARTTATAATARTPAKSATTTTSTTMATTDSKKRLSTVSGPSTPRVDDAASEKMQSLQEKLSESEATVTSLKSELDAVNDKMAQLAVSAQDEATKIDGAAAVIRADHAAELEKVNANHSERLLALQVKLEEAETRCKELEEHYKKELEDTKKQVLDQNDTKSTALLEELQSSHKAELDALGNDLNTHKTAISEYAEKVKLLERTVESHRAHFATANEMLEEKTKSFDQLERELEGREYVIENLKTELMKLDDAKRQEVFDAEASARQTIASLEGNVASLEEKLAQAESASMHISEETSRALLHKDQEISQLSDEIQKLQGEIRETREAGAKNVEEKIKEMEQIHAIEIDRLKAEHEASLASLVSRHKDELSQASASSNAAHTVQLQELQDKLQAAEAAVAAVENARDVAMSELTTSHQAEIQVLQDKIQASEMALTEARDDIEQSNDSAKVLVDQEIASLKLKIQSLESELTEVSTETESLRGQIKIKDEQLDDLQNNLSASMKRAKAQDNKNTETLRIWEEKVVAAESALESQLAAIVAKHSEAMETLKTEHKNELEMVRLDVSGSHQSALQDLQLKHEELRVTKSELESAHAKRIELLESELQSALDRHAADMASLAASRDHQMAELQEQFEQAKATLKEDWQKSQSHMASEVDAEHNQAIEELLTAQKEKLLELRTDLGKKHNAEISRLQKSHDVELGNVNSELAQARTVVDELSREVLDLRQKLAEAEKAKVSAMERVSSAADQMADKHAAELSKIRSENRDLLQQHSASNVRIQELLAALSESDGVKSELSSTNNQLAETMEELKRVKSEHDKAVMRLEEITELNLQLEDKFSGGERHLNDQIERNMSLLEQLGNADIEISNSRKRMRELEAEVSALKAEQQRTKLSPVGLEGSMWAKAEDEMGKAGQPDEAGLVETEGEDLGSNIQGTMASIQAQIRQLQADSEDIHDDYKRFVGELGQISDRLTPGAISRASTPQTSRSSPDSNDRKTESL